MNDVQFTLCAIERYKVLGVIYWFFFIVYYQLVRLRFHGDK